MAKTVKTAEQIAAEKEAKEKAAQEAAEKAAQEEKEKAEAEAKTKSEQETAAKAAAEKAEQEAKEKAAQEAIKKAEQDVLKAKDKKSNELETKANAILKDYPQAGEVHFTADGFPFLMLSDASNHAKTLDDKTVKTIKRK